MVVEKADEENNPPFIANVKAEENASHANERA